MTCTDQLACMESYLLSIYKLVSLFEIVYQLIIKMHSIAYYFSNLNLYFIGLVFLVG